MEREQPDVFCLQEIKAAPDQIPMVLCEIEGYWCYWHGEKGYSGVGLHVRRRLCPSGRRSHIPRSTMRTGSSRSRSGGRRSRRFTCRTAARTFRRRCSSSRRSSAFAAERRAAAAARDLRRPQRRAHRFDVHPKERKPRAIGQLPEERELIERIIGHGLVDVGRALDPDNDQMFTWWAPWRNMRQRNIGWRLDYVLASHALFDVSRAATSSAKSARATTRRYCGVRTNRRSSP